MSSVLEDLNLVKQGSYSQVSGDVLDHVLYDEMLFAATTCRPSTSFFTTPIGGAFGTVTKTKQETNMTDPGKLPAGQGFLIKEIGFNLPIIAVTADNDAAAVMQAIVNILAFSVFEIRIAGREFDLQIPGTMFLPAIASRTNSVIVAATALPAYSGEYLAVRPDHPGRARQLLGRPARRLRRRREYDHPQHGFGSSGHSIGPAPDEAARNLGSLQVTTAVQAR